jgi:hypothetical protein
VKSLIPLAREIIFKDKDLKAFLLANKVGSILFGCLVFLFLAFLYVAELADNSSREIEKLKFSGGYDSANIIDLKGQIESLKADKGLLMQQLQRCGVPPATLPGLPDNKLPPTQIINKASKTQDKPTSDGLKSYFEERLRALEQR